MSYDAALKYIYQNGIKTEENSNLLKVVYRAKKEKLIYFESQGAQRNRKKDFINSASPTPSHN